MCSSTRNWIQWTAGFGLAGIIVTSSACSKSGDTSPGGSSSKDSDDASDSESSEQSDGDDSDDENDDESDDSKTSDDSDSEGSSDEDDSTESSDDDSNDSTSSDDEDDTSESSDEDDSSSTSDSDDSDTDDTPNDPDEDTPFGINGRLQVIGTDLSNQFGNPIQLRGMGSHGLQWFETCLPESALDVLAKDFGADVVRLSMYIQEDGYETDPEYFRALIDKLVDQVYERGMYVIIDWHVHYPGDPNLTIDLAREFFEHMSAKHGSKGHVIYEIANEPNDADGPVDWSTIKRYADEIIPIIRNHDPESVVIVGTPQWSSQPQIAAYDPLDYDNLLYTMHFYAAAHGEDYMNNVREAVENGVGVFVTEFGSQDYSGDGENDFDAGDRWLALLAQYNVSWTNWNFSDDHRSGAVWKYINKNPDDENKEDLKDKASDVCKEADWNLANLKPAGEWIIEKLNQPADDFPVD